MTVQKLRILHEWRYHKIVRDILNITIGALHFLYQQTPEERAIFQ